MELVLHNSYVLECIVKYLELQDVLQLARSSTGLRSAVNFNHIWFIFTKKRSWHTEFGKLSQEVEFIGSSLQPPCPWWQHYIACCRTRMRWRTGRMTSRKMKIPNSEEVGKVTCFDCDGDTLCVGTEGGFVIVWNIDDGKEGLVTAAAEIEIEKIVVTKKRIVVVHSCSVLVFSSLPDCSLIFCKEIENTKDSRTLVSVSWHVGQQKLALTSQESGSVDILALSTGLTEQVAALEKTCTIVKISFLKYQNQLDRIFCVTKSTSSKFGVNIFDIKSQSLCLNLNVQSYFNQDFQVHTILSPSGVILFGRQLRDDLLPYTWFVQKWSYEGKLEFSRGVHTEYMLHMVGLSTNNSADLILPFINHGPNILICNLKTAKTVLTVLICVWEKGMKVLDALDPAKMLMVSSFLGSVCVTSEKEEGGTVTIRDIENMEQLGSVDVPGSHDFLWADSHKLITINRNLSAMTPINIVKF